MEENLAVENLVEENRVEKDEAEKQDAMLICVEWVYKFFFKSLNIKLKANNIIINILLTNESANL